MPCRSYGLCMIDDACKSQLMQKEQNSIWNRPFITPYDGEFANKPKVRLEFIPTISLARTLVGYWPACLIAGMCCCFSLILFVNVW